MQALAAHEKRSPKGGRRWPWVVGAVVVVLLAAGGGIGYALSHDPGKSGKGTLAVSCTNAATCPSAPTTVPHLPLRLATSTPATGATGVPSNTTLQLQFDQPVATAGPTPSITPPVSGTWQRSSRTLAFSPLAPFVPFQKYTVTAPGGSGGLHGADGRALAASTTVTFTAAAGNVLRLQQLLAMLNYLPVAYTEPTGVAPQDMALPQAGTLQWRWAGVPTQLMDVWAQGQPGVVTKAAVMNFEVQNGLTVDGVAGPQVWSTLMGDVATNKANAEPYTYVLVSKTMPQEHLTAWVNGSLQFQHILVNTGVNGAATTDGTFPVFEHVKASTMIGTNVTGSHYDDPTVPWASYFNGGDALHGFPRAKYGFPQSNGCVEMNIATAGNLWPDTPIGTLVTVIG
ncbi:MAG: Ig-like domain-containing protein [Acidimicrobiales bacterium]